MKYNAIYTSGENNESCIRSRQVPVRRGLISIVLSVIDSGPNNHYGIDGIPVCTGSGMYRLHCTYISVFDTCLDELTVNTPKLFIIKRQGNLKKNTFHGR